MQPGYSGDSAEDQAVAETTPLAYRMRSRKPGFRTSKELDIRIYVAEEEENANVLLVDSDSDSKANVPTVELHRAAEAAVPQRQNPITNPLALFILARLTKIKNLLNSDNLTIQLGTLCCLIYATVLLCYLIYIILC